jgi:hypothetical protein
MTTSESVIDEVLAKHTKMGERKREQLATLIDDALIEAGFDMNLDDLPDTVEVPHARAVVETVGIYGLVIEVDANGRAATVSCPDGFWISE